MMIDRMFFLCILNEPEKEIRKKVNLLVFIKCPLSTAFFVAVVVIFCFSSSVFFVVEIGRLQRKIVRFCYGTYVLKAPIGSKHEKYKQCIDVW